ncbi:MAG: hypothetical protein V1813_00270 [Candidatus Aenigmatarchaeota archaeon]
MNYRDAAEFLDYVPRDLSLVYSNGSKKFYISPLRDIMGGVLIRKPTELKRRIAQTQEYKQEHFRELKEGRSYESLFPWPEEMLYEEDIAGLFRSDVRKENDAYTLFSATPNKAIERMYLKGDMLTSHVKSKRRPKGISSNYYITQVSSPFTGAGGGMNVDFMNCACPDHSFGREKRSKDAYNRCMHQAAMAHELKSRLENPDDGRHLEIKGSHRGKEVFFPFAFTENYVRNPSGVFVPADRSLAALEYDALMSYYCIGGQENLHFGIDRRLYQLPEIYSKAMREEIRRGGIKREVVGQGPRKGADADEMRAKLGVFEAMRRILLRNDYLPVGDHFSPEGRCLELGGDIALRFEKGPYAVSIVPGSGGPMYAVCRTGIDSGHVMPWKTYTGEKDPFLLLGQGDVTSFDDRSMRDTTMSVQLPSAFRLPDMGGGHVGTGEMPDMLKNQWREAIRKSNDPSDHERKLKYARLKY